MLRRYVQLQYCEYKHIQQGKVHDENKKCSIAPLWNQEICKWRNIRKNLK